MKNDVIQNIANLIITEAESTKNDDFVKTVYRTHHLVKLELIKMMKWKNNR